MDKRRTHDGTLQGFVADWIPPRRCRVREASRGRYRFAGEDVAARIRLRQSGAERALSRGAQSVEHGLCAGPLEQRVRCGGLGGPLLRRYRHRHRRIDPPSRGGLRHRRYEPTYGRVSCYGVIPLAPDYDHVGPMTRTVRDNALMLQAIAGYDSQARSDFGRTRGTRFQLRDRPLRSSWSTSGVFRAAFSIPSLLSQALRRHSTKHYACCRAQAHRSRN